MANPTPKSKSAGQKQPSGQKTVTPSFNPSIIYLGLLVSVLLLVAYVRIRLSSFPLERDEGEYAYFGQLILHGIPPFKMAYNLKLPGTYYSYALVMGIFGQTAQGIRSGLLLFNLGSLILLYFIVRKLLSEFAAAVSVVTTGLLMISPSVLGMAAHATQFVTFYMLGGTWLLLLALDKQKARFYLFAGLMMGLSFLMKQSAIFFPIFGGLVIVLYYFFPESRNIPKSLSCLAVYATGAAIPLALVFLVLLSAGVFDKFWFWTFVYPKFYGARIQLSDAWRVFTESFQPIARTFLPLWIAAALGVMAVFLRVGKLWNRIFILAFFVFSLLSVVPGFYFRQHYFVTLLPAVGILAGMAFECVNSLVRAWFRYIPVVTGSLFIFLIFTGVSAQRSYFFDYRPEKLCRILYAGNYFTEAIPISEYIAAHSTEEDTVFVLGSEPEIFFYSRRVSATGYLYMYDLVFDHPFTERFQEEMFREVEKSNPKFIVFVSCRFSWLASSAKADSIFKWFNRYSRQHRYIPVGVMEYSYPEPSVFAWDSDAMTYKPKAANYMILLKRSD